MTAVDAQAAQGCESEPESMPTIVIATFLNILKPGIRSILSFTESVILESASELVLSRR